MGSCCSVTPSYTLAPQEYPSGYGLGQNMMVAASPPSMVRLPCAPVGRQIDTGYDGGRYLC